MTRTQFLASICAIPFIRKYFKPKYTYYCVTYREYSGKNMGEWNGQEVDYGEVKKRWMQITIPYTGNDKVLGYPDVDYGEVIIEDPGI